MNTKRNRTEFPNGHQAETSTMQWIERRTYRRSHWLLFGLFTLTTVAMNSSTIKAQSQSVTIAQTGDVAPDGNGTIGLLATPIINASGHVMFQSILNNTSGGTADDRAVYRWNNPVITQLVRKGQSAPDGNGTVEIFLFPTFNDLGQVAFSGNLLGTGGAPFDAGGIFRAADGGVTQIARDGQSTPDGNGMYFVVTSPKISNTGQVAFHADLTNTMGGSTDNEGVFQGNGGAVTQIAREGQTVPGATGTFLDFGIFNVNDVGQVAFASTLSGTAAGSVDNQGIYKWNGTSAIQIARKGQTSPDGNGMFSDLFFNADINNSGQVAFFAVLTGTSGGVSDNRGVYCNSGGTITQIARRGQLAPDGNGIFSLFGNPVLNETGEVRFNASLNNTTGGSFDDNAIFLASGGSIAQIVREGQGAPDGNGALSTFGIVEHNNSGQFSFECDLIGTLGGAMDDNGIFTTDGIELIEVVRKGTSLAESTISSLTIFSDGGLNDFGQITFHAALVNGDQVVRRWTPDLHWRSSTDGTWDTGNNWTLGLAPAEVHNVFIDPDFDVEVNGPVSDSNVRNLTVGGGSGSATLVLDGSELAFVFDINNGLFVLANGTLTGNGQINGNTEILGELAPGNSAGHLSFQGNLVMEADSLTRIELGGTSPNDFDAFTVTNNLTLAGDLMVELIDGHTLGPDDEYIIGNVFEVRTGEFNGLGEGDLVGSFDGTDLFITYAAGTGNDIALFTQVSDILLGDVNLDGFVNLLDVGPFVALLIDQEYLPQADLNQDLAVNLLDVAPFVELLSSN